jgi:hypothetical protein
MADNNVFGELDAETKSYFENRGDTVAPKETDTGDEPLDVVDGDEIDEPEVDEIEDDAGEPERSDKQKRQVVPIKALHKEREQRKVFEAKTRELEIYNARVTERMEMMLRQMQPQDDAQSQEIDADQDPIGAFKQESARRQELEQRVAAFEQARAREAEETQIVNFAKSEEAKFIEVQPDYYDATEHLKQVRFNELTTLGYAPQQIQEIMYNDVREIIVSAAKAGRSPAEVAYEFAKGRGYVVRSKSEVAPPQLRPSTKSLSQGSGSASSGTMTAADFLALSPEDAEEFMTKQPAKFKKLLGG